jgi:hypothetical protein
MSRISNTHEEDLDELTVGSSSTPRNRRSLSTRRQSEGRRSGWGRFFHRRRSPRNHHDSV